MRLLLDTHTLLWHFEANTSRLSRSAIEAIADRDNTCHISAASIWEIAIKIGRGRLSLDIMLSELVDTYVENGVSVLPVTVSHAMLVQSLPEIPGHRDPFDRILIAQSMAEDMCIVTADAKFALYDIIRIW